MIDQRLRWETHVLTCPSHPTPCSSLLTNSGSSDGGISDRNPAYEFSGLVCCAWDLTQPLVRGSSLALCSCHLPFLFSHLRPMLLFCALDSPTQRLDCSLTAGTWMLWTRPMPQRRYYAEAGTVWTPNCLTGDETGRERRRATQSLSNGC